MKPPPPVTSHHVMLMPARRLTVQEKPVWRHSVLDPPCSLFCCFALSCLFITWQSRQAVSLTLLLPATSDELIMDYHQSFSSLNERLRPRMTSSPQLYSSLTRVEERQSGSLRSLSSSNRPTFSFMTPEPKEATAEPEDPEQPEDTAEQDFVSGGLEEGRCDDSQPFFNSCLITELNLKDLGDEDTVTSPSEEKDIPGELVSKGSGNSSESAGGEGGSPFQRSYEDGSLPDLIRSGRPLARRRTVGHVTETVGLQTLHLVVGESSFPVQCTHWSLMCQKQAWQTIKPVVWREGTSLTVTYNKLKVKDAELSPEKQEIISSHNTMISWWTFCIFVVIQTVESHLSRYD